MPVFALCDANNFYCSCERAFDPRIKGKPVVVLSNNDGCCIARSQEAKDLGIKMGDPWHKIAGWAEAKGVRKYSSNYELYGDMSRRIFEVLCRFSPDVEPYSIDEMFLSLDAIGGTWSTTPKPQSRLSNSRPASLAASALRRRKRRQSWPITSRRNGPNMPASAICAAPRPAASCTRRSRYPRSGGSAGPQRKNWRRSASRRSTSWPPSICGRPAAL